MFLPVSRIYVSHEGKASDILEVKELHSPQIYTEACMKILAIDLGKFKSVACLLDTENSQTKFQTIPTLRWAIEQLLYATQPQQVVFETSTVSGWIHD